MCKLDFITSHPYSYIFNGYEQVMDRATFILPFSQMPSRCRTLQRPLVSFFTMEVSNRKGRKFSSCYSLTFQILGEVSTSTSASRILLLVGSQLASPCALAKFSCRLELLGVLYELASPFGCCFVQHPASTQLHNPESLRSRKRSSFCRGFSRIR